MEMLEIPFFCLAGYHFDTSRHIADANVRVDTIEKVLSLLFTRKLNKS